MTNTNMEKQIKEELLDKFRRRKNLVIKPIIYSLKGDMNLENSIISAEKIWQGFEDEFTSALNRMEEETEKRMREKLIENRWHIGDGVDDCSGFDFDQMKIDFGITPKDYYGD